MSGNPHRDGGIRELDNLCFSYILLSSRPTSGLYKYVIYRESYLSDSVMLT